MNDEPNCWTCAYRDLPETAEPCASCDMYFSHFESTESTEPTQATDTAASEDARREAEMAGPTCLTCKHKGVSIEEEPCISCNGYQNYTSDEIEDFVRPACEDCRYRMRRLEEEPCLSCYRYSEFNPIKETVEGTENEEAEQGIDCPEYEEAEDIMKPSCESCKYKNLDRSVEPCHSCFYDRFGNPMNYVEATESGDEGSTESGGKGIMPKHIVDMFAERMKQAALRFMDEYNAYPRPCPYCGELPEVVEETIYPGEKHCYVVCNGAKHLPHSISVHGRTREEAVAHWNSFAIDIISQRK